MLDASELHKLSGEFATADRRAQLAAVKAVTAGTKAIEVGARRRVQGLAHAPAYPSSITSEVHIGHDYIEGEVGPDKDRAQGALGNLIEYGSANNAPIEHLGPELMLAAPFVERDLADHADPFQ